MTKPEDSAVTDTPAATLPEDRPTGQSILRGLRRLCPQCGQGPMFTGYLKVHDACPVCREELNHHRADDGPAYLTILVVGHILGVGLHLAFVTLRPDPLVLASTFTIGAVALSLFLLPRLKGGLIALQWAKRMHGFGRGA